MRKGSMMVFCGHAARSMGRSSRLPMIRSGLRPHKRFYEKVVRVKADVAALLNNSFASIVDPLPTRSHERLLADATHRCRASIRTLNGPLLGLVHLGSDLSPRSITTVTDPGDCTRHKSQARDRPIRFQTHKLAGRRNAMTYVSARVRLNRLPRNHEKTACDPSLSAPYFLLSAVRLLAAHLGVFDPATPTTEQC